MDSKVIGSFLLLLIYFIAGLNKIPNISSVSKGLKGKLEFLSLPIPFLLCKIIIISVIILEIFAPILIIYSLIYRQYSDYAYILSLLLIAFTITVTLLYHFPTQPNQYYYFIKNVSIIGGLFFLLQ